MWHLAVPTSWNYASPMSDGVLILVAGGLLAAGIGASLLAARLRVPALVLFLGVGMAIGSDGADWIDFADYELSRRIGIIALALILFEGGLAVRWAELRPVILLATVGTVLTAALTGLMAYWLFDLALLQALLIGAILSATDGAAIFSLLRGSRLRRRLASTLEGEAGLNDPVAVVLVIGLVEWIQQPDYGLADMALLFARQITIGAAAGFGVGFVAVLAFRRLRLGAAGMYPVMAITTAAVTYGSADALHGSGFLAVYLAAAMLAAASVPALHTIEAFHQGAAWVAQIAVFLTLGLLVFPAKLPDVWLEGLVIGLVSVALARPASVMVATAFDAFSNAERVTLGWAGLRGAVPVVLATFPVIAGIPESETYFNIVFFAVVISTVLQGATVEPLARRLRVTTSRPSLPRPIGDPGTIRRLGAELIEWTVEPGDAVVGALVRDLGLPREALITLIVRDDAAIPPRGSTRITAGDVLHILVRTEEIAQIPDLLERWRQAPADRQPDRGSASDL
jgi:potassium/hydrogen antiporter